MQAHEIISFGDWVRHRRKALDLTQEALAERAACSLALIRKLERDERRPSLQIAELLATALGIDAQERVLFLKVARSQVKWEHLGSISSPQVNPSFTPPSV